MPNGKPNILVIWGDDIGITNLSCYSDGVMGYRTPNIDRIANEGMRFTDSYGEQSCTAGRAAFISGQSVYRTGMSKVGVPAYAMALTIVLQLGAGLLLALGWHARLGALSLALFCLATAFAFHSDFTTRNELLHFEKDLAIAGGMLVLVVAGAGAWSLDRLWGRRMIPAGRLTPEDR